MFRLTPLAVSLLLAGCNAIPSDGSSALTTSINDQTNPDSQLISGSEATSQGDIDLQNEALAQQIRRSLSEATFASHTETNKHWNKKLDLTRPEEPAPDDLYQILRKNFTFDLDIENKRIDSQLNWYASHQSYINRVSQRASRYMYHIISEIQSRNLPVELALLPIVESAFDPFAYSHGSASGMWQFIPSTGKMYGLKQNWWYDGRRDVVASTDAALNYLSQLNQMFDGDWLLALASYNSGPGTVLRAQKKNRSAGKPTDFWNLDLPRETEAYVPKMIALAKLFSEPEKYGIELPVVANEPYFEIVETGGQIDLAQAATLAEMDLSDLYILNPGFNRWATDPDGPHQLLVLADKAEVFNQNIAQLAPDERLTWTRYTIKSGDSLLSIAHKHDVTVDVLKDVNNIQGNLIQAGKTLLIPIASKGDQYYSMSADNRLKVKQNAAANTSKQRVDYTVKSGDSFWTIARRFDVSVASIAKWNNMAPKDVIRPGQTLAIWVNPSDTQNASSSRQVVRKVGYVVRKGDSLYRIADKFNLKISDIEKWNQISSKYLQPGDRLTLYVDVTSIQ
jgi:membrane-bound lytic murein transglycosylase D